MNMETYNKLSYCHNCRGEAKEHVDSKCLYGPTSYERTIACDAWDKDPAGETVVATWTCRDCGAGGQRVEGINAYTVEEVRVVCRVCKKECWLNA